MSFEEFLKIIKSEDSSRVLDLARLRELPEESQDQEDKKEENGLIEL